MSANKGDSERCELIDDTYSSPVAPFKVPIITPWTRMGSEFSIMRVSVALSFSSGPLDPTSIEAPKSSRKANLESWTYCGGESALLASYVV